MLRFLALELTFQAIIGYETITSLLEFDLIVSVTFTEVGKASAIKMIFSRQV